MNCRIRFAPPRRSYISAFLILLASLFANSRAVGQSNVTVRVMAANLTGDSQTYTAPQIRIFQGLKPDVVCIQEFNYGGSIRSFVDEAFGTNFNYYRETDAAYTIPNGIISRWPILDSGSWDDTEIPNRGFAWARIDLPGTNDLYAVSVHFSSNGGSSARATEAANLKTLIQASFPSGAWIVVAGDLNTDSRTETANDTLTTFLSDSPIPSDAVTGGDEDTNLPRNKPYDYVLPSFSLAARLTNAVFASHSFSKGLVFDSRAYSPLSDVSPVLQFDSTNGQHMAVIKDFLVAATFTNANQSPTITTQPQSQTNAIGTLAHFAVGATGTAPLAYQWRFNGTNISNATGVAYDIASVQQTNAGGYSVVVTNAFGVVTSQVAQLVVLAAPLITSQPQSVTVVAGSDATFGVTAAGNAPLSYQWRFSGTNIANATASSYTRTNAQLADAGNYTVVVTNNSGGVTSAVAVLTVLSGLGTNIAQWNFNSGSDSNTATGTLASSIGVGTSGYIGGTAAAGSGEFASGSANDPNSGDNSAWNTSSYPASTSADRTAGVRFNVSTAGRQNIVIRWDQRHSGSASKYTRLQYTTNGTDFISFNLGGTNTTTNFEPKTNSLAGIPSVNNNSNFAFRIVAEFESSAVAGGGSNYVGTTSPYGTGGTVRFDMVTVFGDAIQSTNPSAQPAVLSAPTMNAGTFSMIVTGSAGTNYFVQSATNLTSPSWVSLMTNVAPFTFYHTNAGSAPIRFYRAVTIP